MKADTTSEVLSLFFLAALLCVLKHTDYFKYTNQTSPAQVKMVKKYPAEKTDKNSLDDIPQECI